MTVRSARVGAVDRWQRRSSRRSCWSRRASRLPRHATDGSSGWTHGWSRAWTCSSSSPASCVVVAVLLGRRWPVWATRARAAALRSPCRGSARSSGAGGWASWPSPRSRRSTACGARSCRRVAASLIAAWYCGTETPAYLPIGAVTSGTGRRLRVGHARRLHRSGSLAVVGVAAAIGASQRSRRREAAPRRPSSTPSQVESLAGERARLARDLHDVVAHHVSLVAVRAESAPFLHPGLNDDARGVLAAIALDAREALTELRQVLVVLQRTSDDGDRAPQPTACDVDDLVAGAVAAGQPIDARRHRGTTSRPADRLRALPRGPGRADQRPPARAGQPRPPLTRTQSDDAVGFR